MVFWDFCQSSTACLPAFLCIYAYFNFWFMHSRPLIFLFYESYVVH